MGKSTDTPSKIFKGFGAAPAKAEDPERKSAVKAKSKPAAKRNGTAAGRRYMAKIAKMACLTCELLGISQSSKTDVHHVREGVGAQQRNSDFLTAPLCHDECHQGPRGVHGDKSILRLLGITEMDLLAMVNERLEAAR